MEYSEVYRNDLVSNCISYCQKGQIEDAITDINELLSSYLVIAEKEERNETTGITLRILEHLNFLISISGSIRQIQRANE